MFFLRFFFTWEKKTSSTCIGRYYFCVKNVELIFIQPILQQHATKHCQINFIKFIDKRLVVDIYLFLWIITQWFCIPTTDKIVLWTWAWTRIQNLAKNNNLKTPKIDQAFVKEKRLIFVTYLELKLRSRMHIFISWNKWSCTASNQT